MIFSVKGMILFRDEIKRNKDSVNVDISKNNTLSFSDISPLFIRYMPII